MAVFDSPLRLIECRESELQHGVNKTWLLAAFRSTLAACRQSVPHPGMTGSGCDHITFTSAECRQLDRHHGMVHYDCSQVTATPAECMQVEQHHDVTGFGCFQLVSTCAERRQSALHYNQASFHSYTHLLSCSMRGPGWVLTCVSICCRQSELHSDAENHTGCITGVRLS